MSRLAEALREVKPQGSAVEPHRVAARQPVGARNVALRLVADDGALDDLPLLVEEIELLLGSEEEDEAAKEAYLFKS